MIINNSFTHYNTEVSQYTLCDVKIRASEEVVIFLSTFLNLKMYFDGVIGNDQLSAA